MTLCWIIKEGLHEMVRHFAEWHYIEQSFVKLSLTVYYNRSLMKCCSMKHLSMKWHWTKYQPTHFIRVRKSVVVLCTFISLARKNLAKNKPGNNYWRERLSSLDLLIMVAFCKKKGKYCLNTKMPWSKIVSTSRSTVLSLNLSVRLPWTNTLAYFVWASVM